MEVNNAVKNKVNGDSSGARNNYDRFQDSGPGSYFSPYRLQKSFNDSRCLQDYTPPPSTVWPALEDNCKSVDFPQGTPNNRYSIDASNCGSEADLYGLVSNILDEPDLMDPYSAPFSQNRASSCLKSVWSPKLMKEDSLQYFNNEVQMMPSSGFPSNQICSKPITDVCPQFASREPHEWAEPQNINGFDPSAPPYNFSSCSGEVDAYFSPPQNLPRPPGLTPPSGLSSYVSPTRVGKPEYITPEKDEGYCSSTNCLSDYISAVKNSSRPPNKMNGSYFSSSHDFTSASKDKLRKAESFSVQDVSKLAFPLTEQDGGSTQNGLLVRRNHEEIVAEQKSHPYQRMSEPTTQLPDSKREITHSHVDQGGADVGVKQTVQSYFPTNEFLGFSQPPPKPFSATFIQPTLQPNKEASQIRNSAAQTSVNQFQHMLSNQYQIQARIPNKTSTNLESQSLAKLMSLSGVVSLPHSQQAFPSTGRVPAYFRQGSEVNLQGMVNQVNVNGLRNGVGNKDMSDFYLENKSSSGLRVDGPFTKRFSVKPKFPAGFPKKADKKPGLMQNPYQGSCGVYGGQVRHIGAGSNAPKPTPSQLFPFLYQMRDPRKNACHSVHSQPLLPYNTVSHADVNRHLADGEISPLSPYLQESTVPGQVTGDGSFSGSLPAMNLHKYCKELGSPNSQLDYYLEECYKQWRMLEDARKKVETVLIKNYPGKHVSVVTSSTLPKMPPDPTRVDRLIVDQLQEHAKVADLLEKMEQLRSFPLHANISLVLDRHLEVIYTTQARREDDFINASSRQRQPATYLREQREKLLASAVKDLCNSTKNARCALSNALQMTLPKTSSYPEERQEKGTCSPAGQDSPEQSSLERALIAL